MSLQKGPSQLTAHDAYEAFELVYPPALQQLFDSIWRIEDRQERENQMAELSNDDRKKCENYLAAIAELETTIYRRVVQEVPSYTPLHAQNQHRNENHPVTVYLAALEKDLQDQKEPEAKNPVKNIKHC